MPIVIKPIPGAVARLRGQRLKPTAQRTAQIAAWSLREREEGFFSAGVERAETLSVLKAGVDKMLSGEMVSRAEFSTYVRRALGAAPGDSGRLTDITSRKRLDLIARMKTQDAYYHARWETGQDPDLLDEFPAQEFLRVGQRMVERQNWKERWAAAGGKFFGGRMIARKDDPVWENLSRFGRPWPPFDFGSGMGVEDVDRTEAERLGVIAKGEHVAPTQKAFEEKIEVSVGNLAPEARDMLEVQYGDQVKIAAGKVTLTPRAYHNANDLGLPPVDTWKNLPEAPARMDSKEARRLMERDHYVEDYTGKKVLFNAETASHWDGRKDANIRPGFLPWAEAAIKDPDEHWEQREQTLYMKAFVNRKKEFRGIIVAVMKTGRTHSWIIKEQSQFEKARKGDRLIMSKNGSAQPGGAPIEPSA